MLDISVKCPYLCRVIKTDTAMTTQEIKSKGLKWATGNGCEMYVIVVVGGYQWWMISEKTGTHMVQNKGLYGRAYADERVLAHWSGFKQNQNK